MGSQPASIVYLPLVVPRIQRSLLRHHAKRYQIRHELLDNPLRVQRQLLVEPLVLRTVVPQWSMGLGSLQLRVLPEIRSPLLTYSAPPPKTFATMSFLRKQFRFVAYFLELLLDIYVRIKGFFNFFKSKVISFFKQPFLL